MKIHPNRISAAVAAGFVVTGVALPGPEIHPMEHCTACTPWATSRSDGARMRVRVQRPAGMSRQAAKRALRDVVSTGGVFLVKRGA